MRVAARAPNSAPLRAWVAAMKEGQRRDEWAEKIAHEWELALRERQLTATMDDATREAANLTFTPRGRHHRLLKAGRGGAVAAPSPPRTADDGAPPPLLLPPGRPAGAG